MGLTLHLEGLAKSYNQRQVLAGCSYTFQAGGAYAVMGDNGSGKSTLFRLAALLEAPGAGRVRYLATNQELPLNMGLRRKITMLFPRVGVFSRSVYENVAYGLKIRGLPRNLIQERVAGALEGVGLSHKSRQLGPTLSSGETMRLGLARALALEPEMLFLDEPTTHLDRASAQAVEAVIPKIRAERPLTLVMITHDPAQAERLGGTSVLLQSLSFAIGRASRAVCGGYFQDRNSQGANSRSAQGTAVLAVETHPDFFTFTVRSLSVTEVDTLTFFDVPVAPAKYRGSMASMFSDDADAVCLRGYELPVEMTLSEAPARLKVSTTAQHGLTGWRAGLAAFGDAKPLYTSAHAGGTAVTSLLLKAPK